MMKSLMPALTLRVTRWLQLVPMELLVCTMCSLVPVWHFCKVMRMKSVKFSSTPKETELLRPQWIKPVDFGLLTLAWKFKLYQATKKISSHALSTTKETLSSLAVKITPAVSGKMRKLSRSMAISETLYRTYNFH